MKTIYFLSGALLFIFNSLCGQLLISSDPHVSTLQPGAILQVYSNNKGVLLPQVPLVSSSDNVTVPTPVSSLLVFNTTTDKFNFWENNKWNRIFAIDDGLAIIKKTENFSANSTTGISISSFPSSMPMFNLDDNTTGWTNLNTSRTINITNSTNTNYIIAEGMAQIDNANQTYQAFQFAIGIFVDGKLKLVRKFNTVGGDFVCDWKKFNVAGVFENLAVGSHTISVYGRNLPKITSQYSEISYGKNANNCSNISPDMARIFLTDQITQ